MSIDRGDTGAVRHVTDLPRVAFDPDLRSSFGGSVTVCSVIRNRAQPRVRAMIVVL